MADPDLAPAVDPDDKTELIRVGPPRRVDGDPAVKTEPIAREPAVPPPEPPVPPSPPPEPAEPRKLPEWKVLEPEDPSDAVDHEVCACDSPRPGWTVAAASVRGKLHAHQALWRDDAYGFGGVEDWTILAVSDGAGSARISRVGARIACDEAVRT
jgi:hypothetical protein